MKLESLTSSPMLLCEQGQLLIRLDEYLQYLRVTRSRSRNTHKNAKSILTKFVGFLEEHSQEAGHIAISSPMLVRFLEPLPSASYRYTAIYHLRQFFDFLGVQDNPAKQIRLPRINPSASVKFIEKPELIRLFQELAGRVAQGRNLREAAIIPLILFTGLRADEVLALRKEDLFPDGLLLVRDSKTHESRVSKVPQEVLRAIRDFHDDCPNSDNPYVFYAHKGSKKTPLSYAALRVVTRSLFNAARIQGKNKNLHSLRHTFARSLVEGGFNREEIQKLLGHKSIKTTEIYTRLYDQDILKKIPDVHRQIRTYLTPSRSSYPAMKRRKR